MNAPLEQAIQASVTFASEATWHEYFEFLRQQQYQKIASATPEELLKIQQQVIASNIMEHNFKELRKLDIDKTSK